MTTHDRFDPELLTVARLRAGDADRERTADELRRAHADGRIDADELAERIGRCYSARTFGELQRLTADLLTPERHRSLQRLDHGGRRHRPRIALAVIATLWALAFVAGAAAGHPHPHPFALLVVLVFAFLVTRLVRAASEPEPRRRAPRVSLPTARPRPRAHAARRWTGRPSSSGPSRC